MLNFLGDHQMTLQNAITCYVSTSSAWVFWLRTHLPVLVGSTLFSYVYNVQGLWCELFPRAFGGDPVEPGSQVNDGPAFANKCGNSEDGAKKRDAFPSDT